MPDLFKEIIPSILENKKNALIAEEDEKSYAPFVVNRALSYHLDCILYANEMNKNYNLDFKLQYQYLLNSIRPMKRRFQPWQKAQEDKNLGIVKEHFGYSDSKARDALRILSEEQISEIKIKTTKGGVQK